MQFFIYLVLLLQLSECNDYGKDTSLTKDQLLSLPIPDLAPYDSTKYPLEGLSETRRIYIQSLFAKSIYHQKCDKPSKPIIQPIYFWPGKRVNLQCRMCHRSFVYNGLVKHWSVLKEGISDEIANINSKNTIESENWKIINQEFSDNFVYADVGAQRRIPLMPQRENGGDPRATPKETYRPKTQFFQRDGKLIILHPHMDSYGLYRCFDYDSSKIVDFVYLLIPITPLFTMIDWNVYLHQCGKEKKRFRYFNEFHQFHFLPAILPKQEDICRRLQTPADPDYYCSVDKFNEISQPSLNNIINVSSSFEHQNSQAEDNAEKINLKIFISWSKWSSCKNGEAVKTRSGFCHIGKIDSSKKLDKDSTLGKTIIKLHKFLDNVEEFKLNGIQLFSGVLADALYSSNHNFTHCDDYYSEREKKQDWEEIQKSVINLILNVTEDTLSEIRNKGIDGGGSISSDIHLIESVCLRSSNSDNARNKVEYGQKIIQNEPC